MDGDDMPHADVDDRNQTDERPKSTDGLAWVAAVGYGLLVCCK